eukprot:5492223-Prymnesium_polylepis.2
MLRGPKRWRRRHCCVSRRAAVQSAPADDGRVVDDLVVLLELEVGDGRVTWARVGHHLEAAVHEPLLVQLLEHPPHRLHERQVHRLVVILKVNPAADALDGLLPLLGVAHHNLAALGVVVGDAHLEHIVASLDVERLVDLKLDRQPVAVPPEAALDVVARLVSVAADDVLDGAGEDVAVVRQTRGERRAVVERERRLAL